MKGALEYAQVGGPWHYNQDGPALQNPESAVRYWGSPRFAQAGDAWPLGGHEMSSTFVEAFQSSTSKANALTIRVRLGDELGAKLEWSTDGGKIWTEEIDTREERGGKHSMVYVGFASYGTEVFIDDIRVEQDAHTGGGDVKPKTTTPPAS